MRARDRLIDKRVGERLRLRRLKLKISQVALGKALGVTFQQIQKYESGLNAIASSRIPDLCRVLQILPNDLFESSELDSSRMRLSAWSRETALKLELASPAMRRAIDAVLDTAHWPSHNRFVQNNLARTGETKESDEPRERKTSLTFESSRHFPRPLAGA
jgi:transcriptional regulator with XRE-family HTH domain